MSYRYFMVEKLIHKDGTDQWKRLPDYDEALDAEIAQAFASGRRTFRFTFKSPLCSGTKRQYTVDFDSLRWKRNNHSEEGRLVLLSDELRTKRYVALATNDIEVLAEGQDCNGLPIPFARPPGCLFPRVQEEFPQLSCAELLRPPGVLLPHCVAPVPPGLELELEVDPAPKVDAHLVQPHLDMHGLPAYFWGLCQKELEAANARIQQGNGRLWQEQDIMQKLAFSALDLLGQEKSAGMGLVRLDPEIEDLRSCPSRQNRTEGFTQQVEVEASNDCFLARWHVDERKLHGKDKQIISPPFELFEGMFFILMLIATPMGDRRGQATFRKSRGRGSVVLKYIGDSISAPIVRFRSFVGRAECRQLSQWVDHDFASGITCNSSPEGEEWNFSSAVDLDTSFLVALEAHAITDTPSTNDAP